ncbi:MAG: hypothetical protein WD646_15945 [Actinomycetota bacterium]
MKAAIRTPLMYQRRGRRRSFVPVLVACWIMSLFGLGSGPVFSFKFVALAALGLVIFGLIVHRRSSGLGRIPTVRTQPRNVARP